MVDAKVTKSILLGVALCACTGLLCFLLKSRHTDAQKGADAGSGAGSVVNKAAFRLPVFNKDSQLGGAAARQLEGSLGLVKADGEAEMLAGIGVISNSDRPLAALRRDPSVLLMRNAILDVSALKNGGDGLPVPEGLAASPATRRFAVVFDEPVSQALKDRLAELGATVEGYLPNRALAVTAEKSILEKIRKMAGVAHIEPFHPYFKMSSDIQSYLAGTADAGQKELVNAGKYKLLFFAGSDAKQDLEKMGVDFSLGRVGGSEVAEVTCDPSRIRDLLAVDGVRWVESSRQMAFMNDLADTTLRSRAMKASIPGLDGSGVIVAVNDTGIDYTHAAFAVDPSQATSSNINTRIVYYEYVRDDSTDGIPGDADGHGTHVAASIAGNGAWSTNVVKAPGSGSAPYATNQFAGVAYNAKLVIMEGQSDDTLLCSVAYQKGARISNNSWGTTNGTDYNIDSMVWDFLVRDANDDDTDGMQPYICFFSAGNEGAGGSDGFGGIAGTVAQPGNAKNVITIGAIEQRRRADNLTPYGSIESTDSDWQVGDYSSRGPTPDGRFKPDLVAPGTYVISAQSKDVVPPFDEVPIPYGASEDWHNGNLDTGPKYAAFSGTSMATPLATGCGALFYQYYTNTYSEAPTPSLMKAALIGGATLTDTVRYGQLPGAPMVFQGWGMVDLVKTIKGPNARANDRVTYFNEDDSVSTTNDIIYKTVTVSEENEGGLKITLAWTDYPGVPGAGAALVNDLDLIVRGPDGSVYVGNLLFTYPWGQMSADITDRDLFDNPVYNDFDPFLGDRLNNVEQVIVRHARKGTYTIEIRPYQVPQPNQPFSLVIQQGASSIGDSYGTEPALALDNSGYPVLSTVNWYQQGGAEPNVVGLRHWSGAYGESTEFNTWRVLRDKWYDYGYGLMEREFISGFVANDYVSEPDVAVNPANGHVYTAWVHHNFDSNIADCVFVRYTDGTNLHQLGTSYDTQYGICGSWITEDAFAPSIVIGSDGNPIVAYIQPILNIQARTYYQEVVVKRWNGSSWVGMDGSVTGIVRAASFASSVDLAMNGSSPVVLWYDIRANILRSYSWSGSSWTQLGGDFGYRPVTDSRVRLAVNGGTPVATWAAYGEGSQKPAQTIRVAQFNGSSWAGIGSPSNSMDYPGISSTNQSALNPQIASAGGRVYVAWQNGTTNFNTVNIKSWNGSSWAGVNGSDTNDVVRSDGSLTLNAMVVHPLGLPVIAFDTDRGGGGVQHAIVVALTGDVTPPYFSGINYANGTLSNTVNVGWTPIYGGGQSVTYTVYRSTSSWDPADPSIPAASDGATISSVFANPVGTASNASTLTVSGLTADRVYYWGVRAVNASGLMDSNTRIVLGGPTSPAGDADNDWLTYAEEIALGTSPLDRDEDDDGMWDGWEFVYSRFNTGQIAGIVAFTNGTGMDPFDNGTDDVSTSATNDGSVGQGPYDDLDGDGMFNIEEFSWWTNYYLSLGIGARTTPSNWLLDPSNPDSDGDGMPDGWEYINGLNPVDPSDAAGDPDADGVTNLNEYLIGGNPRNPDSDNDGLLDGQELAFGTRADLPDSDEDGLLDGFESSVNGDPADADSNNNGLSDGDEYQLGYGDVGAARSVMTTLEYQDFETGALPAGWTTFSPNIDLWHITSADPDPPPATPIYMDSHTTNYAFRCANDPTKASTNGTYDLNGVLVYSALDTRSVNPAGAGVVNLYVTWKEWYETEAQWDQCQVLASGDGGVNWNLVRTSVSGVSSGWVTRTANLNAYAGSANLRVRFLLRTLNTINNAYHGWYVDDVRIYGGTRVFGTVRDNNGQPLRNALVYVMGRGGVTNNVGGHLYINPGKVFAQAATVNNGTYSMDGLVQGEYYIKAVLPGYRSEFWNGMLYNTALNFYQLFGGQINPGVEERWRATNPGDLTIANTVLEADFELEKGSSRGGLEIRVPFGPSAVYLSQLTTNALVWNGSTNAPVMKAYQAGTAVSMTHPDWYTNNLELTGIVPVTLEDMAQGVHNIYFAPSVWSNLPYIASISPEVRDGEITVVEVSTNFVAGDLYVTAPGVSYEVVVDLKRTGLLTSGDSTPVKVSVAGGPHDVRLYPNGSNTWLAPKLVEVTSSSRTYVEFSSNDIHAATGSLSVVAQDLNGNPVAGAQVYIDGLPVAASDTAGGTNVTPMVVKNLVAGTHSITVFKSGYKYGQAQDVSVLGQVTNSLVYTLYEADMDYDSLGDAFEEDGYTNIFRGSATGDTDGDGLSNGDEYYLFRVEGVNVGLNKPDSDFDRASDGIEVGFDGITNRLAYSTTFASIAMSDSNVWVYFRGRFLEGVNSFNTNLLASTNGMKFSVDGDEMLATGMVWAADNFGSPVMRLWIPRFGATNRIADMAHTFNAKVFSDMLPDKQDTDGDVMFDGFEYAFMGSGGLDPIEAGAGQNDPDNDGLVNLQEFLGFDGAANTNDWVFPNDADSDNDLMPDGWEIDHGLDPSSSADSERDTDNDGLTALEEWQNMTDPQESDSDSDGLTDGFEVKKYQTNPLLSDTDNDGLLDGEEVVDTDLDDETGIDGGFFPDWNYGDQDTDGYMDGPTDWDTDGDGMPDGFEVKDAWGTIRSADEALDPSDPTDGAIDSDGDSLSNFQEYLVRDGLVGTPPGGVTWDYFANPFSADSDGDGMPDGFEVFYGLHPMDPIPGGNDGSDVFVRYQSLYIYADADFDGLSNTNEYAVRFFIDRNADPYSVEGSSDPANADTDGDGLEDGEEIKVYRSNPISQDSDNDGLTDGEGIGGKQGEINTETGTGLGQFDQSLNDLWHMEYDGDVLPFPFWVNDLSYDPSSATRPSPRWGGAMVHVQYEITDADTDGGSYVSRQAGGLVAPGGQTLLNINKLVLFGGRDGMTPYSQTWEYDIANQAWDQVLGIAGNQAWAFGPAAAVKHCSVDIKPFDNPQCRPRPGGSAGYEWYKDVVDADPVDIWNGGVPNYDYTFVLGGWSGDEYYPREQQGRNSFSQSTSLSPFNYLQWPIVTFVYKAADDDLEIEYGCNIENDAYDWQRNLGLAYESTDFDSTFIATGDVGGYIAVGADATNRIYTGLRFSPVMNSSYDFGAATTNVQATVTFRYYNNGPDFTVDLVAELRAVRLATLLDATQDVTWTSPENYYTEAGQSIAYRPKYRDNSVAPVTAAWTYNSPATNVVFANSPAVQEMTVDVTALFMDAMAQTTGPGDHQWEIGNALGFLFVGRTNDQGYAFIVENEAVLNVTVLPGPYRETYEWKFGDPATDRRTLPFMRTAADMVYMPDIDSFVLFGGVDKIRALDDTWVCGPIEDGQATIDWVLLDPNLPAPPARWGHSMIYYNGQVILFGGFDRWNTPLNDLWSFNGSTWQQLYSQGNEVPPPRAGAMLGETGGFVLLFGGTDGERYFNDTWMLTLPGMITTNASSTNIFETTRWILLQPDGSESRGPAPRAFATTSDTTWLYGGRCGTLPSSQDSDRDMIPDGMEIELGGLPAGRDPRISGINPHTWMYATGAVAETDAYAFRTLGTPQYGNPQDIVNFEAMEYDLFTIVGPGPHFAYAFPPFLGGLAIPIEGHDDALDVLGETPVQTGYDAFAPEFTNQWWHCFNRSAGLAKDPRDSWELGCPNDTVLMSNAVPPVAYSGRWCYGTKLDGMYDNDAVMELYSPLFSLTLGGGNSNSFYLIFHEWVDLADKNDIIRIDAVRPVSAADIATRQTGAPTNGTPGRPEITILPPRNNAANTDGKWVRRIIPLDQVGNEANLFLRFTLQSDSAGTAGGWYIDDVAIAQGGRVSGIHTNGQDIFLLGQYSTNALRQVFAGPTGGFGFDFLAAGNYRILAGDGSGANVGVASGGGTWTVVVNQLQVDEIVLGITVNSPAKISWNAEPGLIYEVQYSSPELITTADPWQTLSTVTPTTSQGLYIDMGSETDNSRFYRVIVTGVAP